MARAVFNGTVIAESDATVKVEGNHYFPPESINQEYLKQNPQTSVCPWKGTAEYFDVEVDGEVAASGAWTYRAPKDAASEIKDHLAFWRGVEVETEDRGLFSRFKK